MADLIKKIKIKKQDGTFTDYIPIGVDAQNVSTSDGDSVQLKLNKKPYYYDTVADMKADTKLKAGDMAVTLGYYEPNDGGGAEYKIVRTSDNLIENLNNNLKAELIIRDKINVNQLGAKSDGSEDVGLYFNKAFVFINNQWLAGKMTYNTVTCEGTYLVTTQIEMPPCAKLTSDGYCQFNTNIPNNSALFVHFLSADRPTSLLDKNRFLTGDLINFEHGCVFNNIYETRQTEGTIAIEIGERSNLGSGYDISRYMVRNFSIKGYHIGLLQNSYNIYCGKYDHLHLEGNWINIQFGRAEASNVNSGESMCISNSVIADAVDAVRFETAAWKLDNIKTSYDFNVSNFTRSDNISSQWGISIFNSLCHFEAWISLTRGLQRIDRIFFNQCSFLDSHQNRQELFFEDSGSQKSIIESSFGIASNTTMTTDPEKLIQLTKNIKYENNMIPENYSHMYFFLYNNLISNPWDNLPDGSIDLTQTDLGNGWTVDYKYGLSNTASIETDNYLYTGHKSLVITRTSEATGGNAVLNLITLDYLPINFTTDGCIMSNAFFYNNLVKPGTSTSVVFYDENKEEIPTVLYRAGTEIAAVANTWVMNQIGTYQYIPANAKYYKIKWNSGYLNTTSEDASGTNYKFGGIIVNKG